MSANLIEQYTVISVRGYDAVEQKVNELIQLGYQPQGGVSMSIAIENGQNVAYYTQAMVKMAG